MKFIFIATFIATIFIDLSQANTQTWELSIKGYLSGFKVGIASGEFIQKKEKIFLNINAETSGIINFFFPISKTKKIRFTKRLIEIGHDKNLIDKIECPIGIQSIEGKEPDVIAISIIARLLEYKSSSAIKEKNYIRLVKS